MGRNEGELSAVFPVLFDGDVAGTHLQLQTYTAMLAFGLIAGVGLALAIARARGLSLWRSAIVFALAVAAVPLGGRLLHVATFLPLFREDPGSALDPGLQGLALYGGLTAAAVVAALAARLLRIDLWRLADAAAPGIALGIAFAKVGCFGAGCCHGIVTNGPLGIVYSLGSPAHGAQLLAGVADILGPVSPVLPIQLFEVAGALTVGGIVFAIGRRAPSGVAFLATAAGFSAVRLALHPLRWSDAGFGAPGWLYPAMYVAIVVVCCSIALWRMRLAVRAGAVPHGGSVIAEPSEAAAG